MKKLFISFQFFFFSVPLILAQETIHDDPFEVKFFTSDIDNFWQAYDLSMGKTHEEKIAIFNEHYFQKGSLGLQEFKEEKIESAEKLVKAIEAFPGFYKSIRENTLKIEDYLNEAKSNLFAFKYLYPDAKFPNVYFVIGRMNAAGTISENGLLIGSEFFGITEDTPLKRFPEASHDFLHSITVNKVVETVIHELVHFQQPSVESSKTVLEKSIMEGSADFLAELACGNVQSEFMYNYGEKHEEELWNEFEEDMDSKDLSRWVYGFPSDRPMGMGYFMGYQIVKAYYDKAENKREAIKQIINISDFKEFIKESGYGIQVVGRN